MNPKRPILVATDFSAPSRHAADRAARLARETGLPLTLMHALSSRVLDELRHWLGTGHQAEQRLIAETGQQLQQLADALAAAQQVAVQCCLATGPVLDVISQKADDVNAGLLVLGARGAGFLRRLMLGSTSERLLRRSTRPLLVVKQMPREPYRRALVALDFSPWSAQAIALVRCVAPQAVLQPAQWDACVVEGEAWQCIVGQEQAHDCDLVVAGKHGQSAAEELLLGSVTQSVLAEGSCDVLVSMARAN
ncbi:universal stress protein [Polaromonas glacialis]|uniref:universal stress protein n=1 Tax=Polaromonas glacialis TaxID=866564 RepID=UPI000496F1B9|nr:universal stress protein [Polaromonas glacialis]